MKKKKLLIRLGAVLAALALLCAAGYLLLFYHADVLKIEDGKISGLKSTWLTAHFAVEGDNAQYYKLADVSTPKNYASIRDAADPDGDPLTTFFAYQGKNAEKNPGTLLIEGVPLSLAEARAELQAQDAYTVEETEEGVRAYRSGPEGSECVYLLPSPYAQACIRVAAALPGEASQEELSALAALGAEKITLGKQLHPFVADFKLNFVDDSRWEYLWTGLGVTLEITFFAVLLGIAIGVVIATIRSTWEKNQEAMRKGPGRSALAALNAVARAYLTVIRGTPVVIQLMIAYYVIFASSRNGVFIAILAFGINSGAYVAEIIRGGILSIDAGQFEAGRSLGFNYVQTMRYVIIPQAFKNVLPALANEFIVLLKETSVAGYVAVRDLTKGGDIIRGVTYSPFLPLLAVAAIYLVMVMFFTWLVGKLERRLRSSDH